MHKRRKCIKPSGLHSLWQEWLCHSSGTHHPCQSYITRRTACWHGMSKEPKSSERRGSQALQRPPTLTSAPSLNETRGSCQSPTCESFPALPSEVWIKHPGASWILSYANTSLQLLRSQRLLCFPLLSHCHFDTGKNEEGSAHQETWCWRNMVLAVRSWRAWIWELCFLFCHSRLCNQASNASLHPAKHKWNLSQASQEWCMALIKTEPCFVAQTWTCRCWWDKQKHLF